MTQQPVMPGMPGMAGPGMPGMAGPPLQLISVAESQEFREGCSCK